MKKEEKAYDILKNLGIEYELFEHEAVYTVEAAEEIDKKIGIKICKNLFLSTKKGTEFYLLTMIGDKKFNTGKVSKQVGVPRMTFGNDLHMEEFLDIAPGSVSPLGLINDKEVKVKFLIDKDVLDMEKIPVHPCINTATVLIKTEDLVNKILPFCSHDYTSVEV